jgi:hypothetical protein
LAQNAVFGEVVLRYFTGAAQEQYVVVLLLKGDLISWSLAMNERDGHEDLCGLGRQSVIPYVYGRTDLYYLSMYV